MTDKEYLQKSADIGNRQKAPRNFGAIIVKNGKIIGEDFNRVHEEHDPSLHAEVSALKIACKNYGSHNLNGATMYGSHEPCIMCFSCAVWAGVDRIVYAQPAKQDGTMYEFNEYTLNDMVEHLSHRSVSVEHISVV